MDRETIITASRKHDLVALGPRQRYTYGTAGFRMSSKLLEGVTFRVGLLAALRSRKLGGQAIGVMVTASHNPAEDNGVKIVDPQGDMLEKEWEHYATLLVNCPSHEALADTFFDLVKKLMIDPKLPGKVVAGRDTRPSGHTLIRALQSAVAATNTAFTDFKIVTTPQLHYLTRCVNTAGKPSSYGEPTEIGYYKKLNDAFVRALRGKKVQGSLMVDCANGVGGPKLKELLKVIDTDLTGLECKIVNDDVLRPEVLNLDCGADFVKTRQRPPPYPKPQPGVRLCSLDGDADRLMYYWIDPESGFFMFDGDRIATLAASFISELFKEAGLNQNDEDLRIGVVQTAYANGASTKYIEKHLKLPVLCTPTGVKYLHHAACSFDIGVYFEANGHGTVLFSRDTLKAFSKREPQSPGQLDALETLIALSDLINQTVGDAISDMLTVEVILAHRGWTLRDWAMTYQDLPNRLARVEVYDKDRFRTVDAERKLSHPEGIQHDIDECVKKYNLARAFVRASGTENAVRIYAEAGSRSEAEELINRISIIVRSYGAA